MTSSLTVEIITLSSLANGSLCRGSALLCACMTKSANAMTTCERSYPKFQPPRFTQYLRAVERARPVRAGKLWKACHPSRLACWVLDREDSAVAIWGARSPDQLAPIANLSTALGISMRPTWPRSNWILSETVVDAVGPEFMAPPVQLAALPGHRNTQIAWKRDMPDHVTLRTKKDLG